MSHRIPRRGLAVLTALSVSTLGLVVPAGAEEENGSARFHISNITDFHGHFAANKSDPGAAMLKCAADEEAGDLPSSFVASGDLVGGSPYASALLEDEPAIETLNQMGLEVSAVGNHEFDKGYADLKDRIEPAADWDYLGANAEGTELAPYKIVELDGVKVAYVGTVTDDMPNLVSPSGIEGIEFTDPIAATNKVADELTESGEADVVVGLFHEGVTDPAAFSENVDVVFAGHTHQPVEPNLDRAEGVPLLMQAGSYSQYLNSVDFSYDRESDTLTVDSAELLDAEAINACGKPDPEIEATVKAAEEAAEEEGAKVVAEIDAPLTRGVNAGGDPGSNRGVESTANNFLADAARWAISNKTSVTADIGVMNAGGVRDDLDSGEVTYAEAFAVQPFGNEITYTRLTGEQFKKALEQQWKDGGERPVLSLGVSDNVSYVYDVEAPAGERIKSVTVDGEPLDPEREYVVAGSTFLLEGGDSFSALAEGSELAATGLMDIEAFVSYLRDNEDAAPRAGQSNVSVHLPEKVAAGEEITVELSSLIYSVDDPAKKVTVRVGDTEVEADIDPDLGEPGHGEAGKASVTLTLPEDATAETELTVTTDAGTEVSAPLGALTEVAGSGDDDPDEPGKPGADGSSGSSGSSETGKIVGGVLGGLLGLGALVTAVLAFLMPAVPGVLPGALDRLAEQFPQAAPFIEQLKNAL